MILGFTPGACLKNKISVTIWLCSFLSIVVAVFVNSCSFFGCVRLVFSEIFLYFYYLDGNNERVTGLSSFLSIVVTEGGGNLF